MRSSGSILQASNSAVWPPNCVNTEWPTPNHEPLNVQAIFGRSHGARYSRAKSFVASASPTTSLRVGS
jgi:hypothetical protein